MRARGGHWGGRGARHVAPTGGNVPPDARAQQSLEGAEGVERGELVGQTPKHGDLCADEFCVREAHCDEGRGMVAARSSHDPMRNITHRLVQVAVRTLGPPCRGTPPS